MPDTTTFRRPDVSKSYHGVVVPMVTPITPQGDLDEPGVRQVIDHLIAGGASGVFVLGTTGEAASVPHTMRSRLIAITVEHVGNRVAIYAGIGHNCLEHSVHAAKECFRLGVDVAVAHLPSYYALSPEEQCDYYAALVAQIPGPLILYNIPSTTHMSIPIEAVEQLSQHPMIVGLKDSEKDVARLEAVMKRLGGRFDFSIFAGVTVLAARALSLGADGMVPSSGNLVPARCQGLYESGIRGDAANAEAYQRQVDEAAGIYQRNRTLGQSLAALKAAMGTLDLCGPDVLPPLRPLGPAEQAAVRRDFLAWQAEQEKARA